MRIGVGDSVWSGGLIWVFVSLVGWRAGFVGWFGVSSGGWVGALEQTGAGGRGAGRFSDEGGDAGVGGGDGAGVGPVVEDADDVGAGVADDAGGGVPEPPAQGFGLGAGEVAGEAEELEPADEVGGEAHDGEPCLVGVTVGEGEPAQPGVFEAADVVLDVGVGAD